MAKILLVGSHLNYNLEHYTKIAFENLGHDVRFFGYRPFLGRSASMIRMAITRSSGIRFISRYFFLNEINKQLKHEALKFRPDIVLSIKGEIVLPKTLDWLKQKPNIKLALWYPDDPRYFRSLVTHIANHYDYIFTASERAIPMYNEIGVTKVTYLPFGCEPSVHKRLTLTKTEMTTYGSDVCFVGAYNRRRAKTVNRLWKAGFNVRVWGPYWKNFVNNSHVSNGLYGLEMVKVFNAAKIILNIHEPGDLPYKVNTRVFEATGSGGLLLTDNSYKLNELFSIGKEVLVYNDIEDLVEKIRCCLKSNSNQAICDRAIKRAYAEHTYKQRIEKLLKTTRP